ncbi:hypothetical protein ANO11243_019950 [Dothideomycetidae sp. 11243]|nr:hypothetical protein ANO11243_019950 [fungal sp. No.11243]
MSQENRKSYMGHCHCGEVRFNCVLAPPLQPLPSDPSKQLLVYRCDCSICIRNGYLLGYCLKEDFNITHGESKIGRYAYGRKTTPHLFCTNCGSSLAIDQTGRLNDDGTRQLAINVRMLRDVDLNKVEYEDFDDGATTGPKYEFADSPPK